MDPDPAYLLFLPCTQIFLLSFFSIASTTILLLFLLVCSALISGSEVAYFSLSPNDLDLLDKEESKTNKLILKMRDKPRKLLATILIANNFINIAIVILSDYLVRNILGDDRLLAMGTWVAKYLPNIDWLAKNGYSEPMILGKAVHFLITVVGVTFLLVLFGEVIPKIYANLNNLKSAKLVAKPMRLLFGLFSPLSVLLVRFTNKMESSIISTRSGIDDKSKAELDKAIQLTVDNEEESGEADILRGILKFGNVSAKQVMKSRVDVIAVEEKTGFNEIMSVIKERGYSRIPVIREDFDEVVGILYAKDLLGYSKEDDDFNWQQFIRDNVLYVPESKKIDDILKEFQIKRLHMAIVVDEFGGSAGIITLEDIVEEVIGEIKDEFDEEEEVDFVKINDANFIFEGKTLLHDVARILNVDRDSFDKYKNETDSLAGLMLNHFGRIPKKDKEITISHYKFKIVSVTKRRIEKIHVTML